MKFPLVKAHAQRLLVRIATALVNLKARHWLIVAALVGSGIAIVEHPGWSREGYRVERMTFTTNVVPGTTNDFPVRVKAELYIPRGVRFPVPAVIIAPSSSGVEEVREIYYAKRFVRSGIAALVLDSFTSRGLTDSLYDQSLLEQWDIENDAIAALERLTKDKRIKPDRIAIMGVSKGGTVAMDTALTIRRKWMGVDDIQFAAHVAISPECTWTTRNANTTGAPILFMLAELDDQTPAKPCVALAQRMRELGNDHVEVKIYEGAHHAWEELGPSPEYSPDIENYANCHVWIEDDGRMYSAETGELLPENDWHGWAKKNCMKLGGTCCGGTRELKEKATRDILTFLKKHGF